MADIDRERRCAVLARIDRSARTGARSAGYFPVLAHPMTWTKAIARITVGGEGGYRGTGALISGGRDGGLVLTAFHVIADHEKSLRNKKAAFYDLPIRVVFGDPRNEATLWVCGDGTATCERHSIDDDWALLRLPPDELKASAFPLAKANALRTAWKTFGFPERERDIGGEYQGTLGALAPKKIELLVDNLPLGADMGGISGAPCLVDGEIVGVIQQSLADENNRATKASLYMLPIERAIASYAGLLDWNDGTKVPFEREVEIRLPDDGATLDLVGERLGLAQDRRARHQIARCLLAKDARRVAGALGDIGLDPIEGAGPILDYVGAMALHPDAVESLRQAGSATPAASESARTPLLTSETKRIHRWYLLRAFKGQNDERPDAGAGELTNNRIVMVRARNGDEELPPADHAASAGEERDQAVAAIIARVRAAFEKRRLGPSIIKGMLSSDPSQTEAQARQRRFWLILAGERRPDVIYALRAKLRNAQIILGLAGVPELPDEHRERIVTVIPLMDIQEQEELIEAWESAALDLDVPVEPEEDDA
jgi:hypothetical protein